MLPDPCLIVSDLHLGVAPREVERSFVRFLEGTATQARALVINGDLFDFWFEWRSVVPRGSIRVLAALSRLVEQSIPVLWVAGNHDCWGGAVLRDEIGVDYHVGPWSGDVAGWRVRFEHGDGLRGREDRGYRALRAIIRHPLAIGAMRLIHPDLGIRLASHSSKTSRDYRARDGGAGLRSVAMGVLAATDAPDLLVYGHSHIPTLERVSTGNVYANAGAWLDGPTYLRLGPQRVELLRWDPAGRSEEIKSLDRRDGSQSTARHGPDD